MQDPSDPLHTLDTNWGNADNIFNIMDKVKASKLHILAVTTREFYQSTLTTAHKSRKEVSRWIFSAKKKIKLREDQSDANIEAQAEQNVVLLLCRLTIMDELQTSSIYTRSLF